MCYLIPELAAPPVGVNINWLAVLQEGAFIAAVKYVTCKLTSLCLSLMYTSCHFTSFFFLIIEFQLEHAIFRLQKLFCLQLARRFVLLLCQYLRYLSSSQCKQNFSEDESPALNTRANLAHQLFQPLKSLSLKTLSILLG